MLYHNNHRGGELQVFYNCHHNMAIEVMNIIATYQCSTDATRTFSLLSEEQCLKDMAKAMGGWAEGGGGGGVPKLCTNKL